MTMAVHLTHPEFQTTTTAPAQVWRQSYRWTYLVLVWLPCACVFTNYISQIPSTTQYQSLTTLSELKEHCKNTWVTLTIF